MLGGRQSLSLLFLLGLLSFCLAFGKDQIPTDEASKMLREEIENLEDEIAAMHKHERDIQRKMNDETDKRKRDEAMAMDGVEETIYTLGPFGGSVMGAVKVPEGKFGVLYWGDWKLLNVQTKEEIPRGEVFLHHVFLYERLNKANRFVSGSSDERVTWGPNFSIGDNAVYMGNSNNSWTISGMLADVKYGLSQKKVLLQYTIRYWREDSIPKNVNRALGVSYTAIPKHELPGQGNKQQKQKQKQKQQQQKQKVQQQKMQLQQHQQQQQQQHHQQDKQQQKEDQQQQQQDQQQKDQQQQDQQQQQQQESQQPQQPQQEEESQPLLPELMGFKLVTSKHHVSLQGPQNSNATLIYATGHIHVGGWSLIVNEGQTGNELCFSRAIHSVTDKCYLECPTCPSLAGRYPALDTMTYCEEGKKTFKISNGFDIIPYYDGRCGFSGLHGSVFAWYVPHDQNFV